MRVNRVDALSAHLALSLGVTGLWLHLDRVGWGIVFLLAGILVLRFWPNRQEEPYLNLQFPSRQCNALNLTIGFVVTAPLLVYLALSWTDETPFGGDNSYHLFVALTYLDFIKRIAQLIFGSAGRVQLLLLSLLAALAAAIGWRMRAYLLRFRLWQVLALMYVLSFFASWAEMQSMRYPTLFYILSIPIQMLGAILSDGTRPVNALRLTNALSLLVWLWCLRPLFLRRWPDLRILPLCLFFHWQPTTLYYLGSVYLEPWALVFVLLAMEAALFLPADEKWVAIPIAASSALAKEPGIFLLPPITMFLALGVLLHTSSLRVKAQQVGEILRISFVSGIPFLLYFLFRKAMGDRRHFSLGSLSYVLSPDRARELWLFLSAQLGFAGTLAVIATLITVGILTARRRDLPSLVTSIFVIVTLVFFLLFFYVDRESHLYIGYSRFQLWWYALVGAALLLLDRDLLGSPRLLFAGSVAMAGLSSFGLVSFLGLSLKSNDFKNSVEHFGAAVYFPVNQILAPTLGLTVGKRKVRVVSDVIVGGSIEKAYPHLAQRMEFEIREPEETSCACDEKADSVMIPYAIPRNLMKLDLDHAVKALLEKRILADIQKRQCLSRMQSTCAKVTPILATDGELWGILGVIR